jgi:hypothetical protein
MKAVLLAALWWTALGGPVAAHHSFATYYFEERSVTIEGDLVSFDYRNPHAWVYLDAADETGVLRRYSAEWSNTNRLASDGITKDTFAAGDRVVITGSPGRKREEFKIHLKRLQRPADGFSWPLPRRGRP